MRFMRPFNLIDRRVAAGVALGMILGSCAGSEHRIDDYPVGLENSSGRAHHLGVILARTENLRQSLEFLPGGRFVEWMRLERFAPGTPWHRIRATFRTPYRLTRVVGRNGGDELYVCGVTPEGSSVIERWTFDPGQSTYRVRPVHAPQPIGQASPSYEQQVIVPSGVWTQPTSTTWVEPTKELIFRSYPATGYIRNIAIDPEGRVLFAITTSSEFLRLDLTSFPITPTVLHDSTSLPHLRTAQTVMLMDHPTEGRKLILSDDDGASDDVGKHDAQFTLFADPENDAMFGPPVTMSAEEWKRNGLARVDWSEFL